MNTNHVSVWDTICGVIKSTLDFIVPQRAGTARIETLTSSDLTSHPRSTPTDGVGIEAIFAYRTPLMRALIWELKYRGNKKAAALCGESLYNHLLGYIEEHGLFEGIARPLVLPIPLSPKRRRERGYNQCELILAAAKKYDTSHLFEFRTDILIKTKETQSQTKSEHREDRLKNLRGAFAVSNPSVISSRFVFIIDDVTTTGATLSEARRTLLAAGAKTVISVAMAH